MPSRQQRGSNDRCAVTPEGRLLPLAAVLGKVLIHLDARLFAPAVDPSGLVKGADKCFDFVAGLSQLLNGFAKLARSGGVLVQQPVPFVAAHSVSQSYPARVIGWDRSEKRPVTGRA
jgi:hypothetical protein